MTLPWLNKKSFITDNNTILNTDFYKCTHWKQYPKDCRYVYSYLESRGGYSENTLWFGAQMILLSYLQGKVVEDWMIDDAEHFIEKVGRYKEYFNRKGWERILNVHGGKLPLRVRAIPEGLVVPTRIPLMSIENTDPELPWLTNWAETLLLHPWYTTTVATTSYNFNLIAKKYAEMCGEQVSPVLLNDFGYRGSSSKQTAGFGGAAHLLNSIGTDTLEGIVYAARYYGADIDKEPVGVSVFATEHSTTTIYTREHEHEALKNFIVNAPDDACVSLVSDSYNIYEACKFYCSIKDIITARKGKVVVRPDSGDPAVVSHEVLNILWDGFGGIINEKGYKVLDPHIGMIYADGIDIHSVETILSTIVKYGKFALSNIVFGMGAGLLQKCDRDTHKFAIKCCAAKIGNDWIDVYKDPITDSGKSSKKGKQAVYNENGKYKVCKLENLPSSQKNLMETIFENGEMTKILTWNEVKNNH